MSCPQYRSVSATPLVRQPCTSGFMGMAGGGRPLEQLHSNRLVGGSLEEEDSQTRPMPLIAARKPRMVVCMWQIAELLMKTPRHRKPLAASRQHWSLMSLVAHPSPGGLTFGYSLQAWYVLRADPGRSSGGRDGGLASDLVFDFSYGLRLLSCLQRGAVSLYGSLACSASTWGVAFSFLMILTCLACVLSSVLVGTDFAPVVGRYRGGTGLPTHLNVSLLRTGWPRHGAHQNLHHFFWRLPPFFELQSWWAHSLWGAGSKIRFSIRRTAAYHQPERYYLAIYVRVSPRMLGGHLLSLCSCVLQFLFRV